MASFQHQVADAKCTDLHRVVPGGSDKVVCFTRLSKPAGEWIMGATDGVTVWKRELDEEETDALRDLAGVSSLEVFLTKVRNGFNSGDIDAAIMGNKVTLTIGKGASCLTFDLYEAKAADKKLEMQSILFRLAESATKMSTELVKANQTIDALKAHKGAGGPTAFMDLGPKKGQNPAKAKPKKTGMSVLNPTSKKRKAAQGVVFD